jgi:hypothetical protein
VRRLVKIALVALGIRWFLKRRKRKREERERAELAASAPTSAPSDPADELRQKLAASREDETAEPEPAPEASVADRRAEVHDQGRATLDEMKSSDEA